MIKPKVHGSLTVNVRQSGVDEDRALDRDEYDDRQDQCLVGYRDNECYTQQGNDVDAVVVRYNNIP